jgi:hypothetical protein
VPVATTAIEKRQRIAVLMSFMTVSGTYLTTDPSTNAAVGAAIAFKISCMKAILELNRGALQLPKKVLTPSLRDFIIVADSLQPTVSKFDPYRIKFTTDSKTIICKMFEEHTNRHFINGIPGKFKSVGPFSLIPLS